MCDECRANFGKLLDREVRCRTSGCKKTWTWTRSDQLDACVAGKAAPKAPARMCESCFETFSRTLKDVERPCRRAGCKGTWTDKRGAQLARAVRGKTGDPYPPLLRRVREGARSISRTQNAAARPRTARAPGPGRKEQQLAAGVKPKKLLELEEAEAARRRASRPQPRRRPGVPPAAARRRRRGQARRSATASAVASPAAGTPLLGLRRVPGVQEDAGDPLQQCATPIYWPPESQLQTHLGNWAEPALCGACKRDATEAARAAEREALREFAHPSPARPAAAGDAAAPAPSPRRDRRRTADEPPVRRRDAPRVADRA